jgi:hypothetical protein
MHYEVESRLTKDIPMMFVVLGIGVLAIIMWLIPAIPVNLLSAIIIIIFGFFFATVSSRMVGLVGSSNNPVSGMAIATLLISSAILKATGAVGMKGMVAAISIGSVICIIAAIAGDTSQDLKTGYIVGATPYKQQAGELIGVAVSAITVGGVLYLLNAAWGYGSTELPAPQATLMKMVVEGVMGNSLPWSLVFAGVAIAIVVEILQIPVLPFAVGLYLPIYLSTPIMVGGLVRLYVDKKKGITEEERKAKVNQGILYSSGLIAGEGLVGILLAVFAIIPVGADTLGDVINISKIINLGIALSFLPPLNAARYTLLSVITSLNILDIRTFALPLPLSISTPEWPPVSPDKVILSFVPVTLFLSSFSVTLLLQPPAQLASMIPSSSLSILRSFLPFNIDTSMEEAPSMPTSSDTVHTNSRRGCAILSSSSIASA